MSKIIKHGLEITASLDAASKKQMKAALQDIFSDGAKIDLDTPENIRGLKAFARMFQDMFAQAGNKNFDFTKIMNLPGAEMFEELKLAAKEFEGVWNSLVSKLGKNGLRNLFMRDQSELSVALNRLTNSEGNINKKFARQAEDAFKTVKSRDINRLLEGASGSKEDFIQASTWEEQSVAALKYLNIYKRIMDMTDGDIDTAMEKGMRVDLKSVFNDLDNIGTYTVQQIESAKPQIQASLQNLFNLKRGNPLIGLTDGGAIDINVAPKLIKTLDVGDILGGKQTIEIPIDLKFKGDLEKLFILGQQKDFDQVESMINNMIKNLPDDVQEKAKDRLFAFTELENTPKDRSYNAVWKDLVGYGLLGSGSDADGDESKTHQQNADAINAVVQAQERLNDAETQNPQVGGDIQQEIKSYEELCQVLERLNTLRAKDSSKLSSSESDEMDAILSRLNNTKGESSPDKAADDLLKWASMVGGALPINTNEMAQWLGIEIPQAAQKAEDAIKDVINAQEKLSSGGNDKTGTGDASSAELEKLEQENDKLRKELEYEREARQYAEHNEGLESARTYEAEQEAAAERKRAQEAENELAKLKAELDTKKLVDNDGLNGDEVVTLRNQLADTENMLADELGKRMGLEDKLAKSQEESERLRKQLANVDTTPNKGKKQTVGGDVDLETAQLKGVREAVEAVTVAVNQKTKAFHDEGVIVGQVVGKEVNTLSHLETQVKGVNEQLNKLFSTLKSVKTNAKTDIKVSNTEASTKSGTTTKDTTSTGETTKRSKAEMNAIEKDYQNLGKMMARLNDDNYLMQSAKIELLEEEIERKQKALGLTEKEIAALKEKEKIAQDAEERIIEAEQKQAAKDKEAADITQRAKDIKALEKQYKQLGELEAQGDAGDLGKAEEAKQLNAIIQQEVERLELNQAQNAESLKGLQLIQAKAKADKAAILAQKQQKKMDDAEWKAYVKAEQGHKGVGIADSTITSANKTVVNTIGNVGLSADIEAKARKLDDEIRALEQVKKTVNNAINNKENIDQTELNQRIANVKRLKEELDSVNAIHEKYSGDNVEAIVGDAGSFKNLGLKEYEAQLTRLAEKSVEGKLRQASFNAETKELTATVKTGTNAFTTYSFAVDEVDGALKKLNQGTKKTETFFEGVGRKFKELAQYAVSSISVYDVWNQIKQGAQYVRDIDTAMTELKKVTNETEATYAKFMNTASQTAKEVGSTITDVINSTADWARLGYSMNDASQLAATTSVLYNVSEFENIDKATSALISTMQAFGYAADESMNVVDVMNEINFLSPYTVMYMIKMAISGKLWAQTIPRKDFNNTK